MPALADLVTWRDGLIKARFAGVRRVRDQSGEEVEYRSDAEMGRAIAHAERLIADASRRPATTVRFSTSKGL